MLKQKLLSLLNCLLSQEVYRESVAVIKNCLEYD